MKRLLLLGMLFLICVVSVQADPPPIAAEYYGLIFNSTAANITIDIRDPSGTICGSTVLVSNTFYGLLSCRGDDPFTTEDEGAEDNDTVSFYLNGTQAKAEGNLTWREGTFFEVNVTKAEPPVFLNCSNASIEEDSNGSQVSIDLHNCTTDPDTALNDINFSVVAQTDLTIIDCFITGGRYVTCHDPLADAFGNSTLTLRARDDAGLSDFTNVTIEVTPLPDPPRFLQNWTDQVINESSLFEFAANCSDPDGDDVNLSSNSSLFPINRTNGIINVTPGQSAVGNNTVNISCTDGNFTISRLLNITVLDINNAPVLDEIPTLIAIADQEFTYDVNATDSDGDTLSFFDNSTLFSIDASSGIITFTPTTAQIGLYSILIGVTDGLLNDTQIVSLRIVQGPFCGDLACGNGEDCVSCPGDCGACPTDGSGGSGGGGAGGDSGGSGGGSGGGGGGGGDGGSGGGGGGGGGGFQGFLCVEKWQCSAWGPCGEDSYEIRTCVDINRCGTIFSIPDTRKNCTLPSCSDGVQNQGETGIDCGGPCDPCPEFATCFDGVQNQGEEGVDCGGPCQSCFLKELRLLPILEQPIEIFQLIRAYPWLLLILALLIILSCIIGDRIYVHHLMKLEFDEFRVRMKRYRPIRRRIFLVAFNISGMLIASSGYVYFYSYDSVLLIQRMWILAILYVLTPIPVSYVLHRYDVLDRTIELRLERAKRLSQVGDVRVMQLEQDALLHLEMLIAKQILGSVEEKELRDAKEVYEFIRALYHVVAELSKKRKAFLKPQNLQRKLSLLKAALGVSGWKKWAKAFSEFDLIFDRAERMLIKYSHKKEPIWEKFDFVTLYEDIMDDVHLLSIIESDNELKQSMEYLKNMKELVDEEISEIEEIQTAIKKHEMLFLKEYQMRQRTVQPLLDGHPLLIRLHNLLVRLYNRYDKNMQLLTVKKKKKKKDGEGEKKEGEDDKKEEEKKEK